MLSRIILAIALAILFTGCRPAQSFSIADEALPCWGGQRLGTHGRKEFFCEANRSSCVAQPANTWSNGGYLAAAAGVWSVAQRRRGCRRAAAAVFGPLLIAQSLYLGIASGLFHASVTHWAERLDLSATYGVLLTLAGHALVRVLGTDRREVVGGVAAAVLTIQAVITAFKYQIDDFWIFPLVLVALVGALAALSRQVRAARPYMVGALLALIAALSVWAADIARVACKPNALLQGHAMWHLLTAVAVFMAYRAIEADYGSSTNAPNASGT